MGTAVLRSYDCLKHAPHPEFFDSRPPPRMNTSRKKPLRSPRQKQPRTARPGRRSRCPDKDNNSSQPEARKPLVMGQFTLLKRGEKPPPPPPPPPPAAERRSDGDVLCSTNRMGPDPEILPKLSDLKKAVYAGPGFNISSPSPSSLPFPAFLLKKSADAAIKSEIATRGLRCLLRLDEMA